MTGFGDAAERKAAAERRRMRMEEARRRVEAGENTSPPAPPPGPAARTSTRAARTPKPAKVDPLAAPGAHFAVWRSAQHFCVADSIPDAEGGDLYAILRFSGEINANRLRQRLIARLGREGEWQPVCYAKDGARESISQAQADKYRDVRLGRATTTSLPAVPLKDTDHPESTVTL